MKLTPYQLAALIALRQCSLERRPFSIVASGVTYTSRGAQ